MAHDHAPCIADWQPGAKRSNPLCIPGSVRRLASLALSKGKLTIEPRRHSGEGVFFTSRVRPVPDCRRRTALRSRPRAGRRSALRPRPALHAPRHHGADGNRRGCDAHIQAGVRPIFQRSGRLHSRRRPRSRASARCLISGYEALEVTLALPDPNDRHVLTAASRVAPALSSPITSRTFPTRCLHLTASVPTTLTNSLSTHSI